MNRRDVVQSLYFSVNFFQLMSKFRLFSQKFQSVGAASLKALFFYTKNFFQFLPKIDYFVKNSKNPVLSTRKIHFLPKIQTFIAKTLEWRQKLIILFLKLLFCPISLKSFEFFEVLKFFEIFTKLNDFFYFF